VFVFFFFFTEFFFLFDGTKRVFERLDGSLILLQFVSLELAFHKHVLPELLDLALLLLLLARYSQSKDILLRAPCVKVALFLLLPLSSFPRRLLGKV